MTATITVSPSTAAPGELVDVDGSGFDPKGAKFALTTVNAAGTEVGQTTNTNRVDRHGTFHVGIKVPPMLGSAKVRAYQGSALKAEAAITVANTPPIVLPFPGFAKADAAVAAGGTVNIPPGVYRERATISKPGVTWIGAKGAVLDATTLGIPIQQGALTIAGADIKFTGDLEVMGSAGSGIVVDGDRVQWQGHLHHCIEEGYVWHGANGLILGGTNHHNNETGQFWDSGEQGCGKGNSFGLVIDGCHVYDIGMGGADPSGGQGLWFDSIGGTKGGSVVRNCVIERVFYAGVMFEIGDGGKFYNNTVHHCGSTPSGSGYWGAGILIATSRNAEVYSNLLAYNKYNGIRVNWQNRGDKPSTGGPSGISLHDNTFIGNGTGFGFESDDPAMFATGVGNVAFKNRFDVPRAYWKPMGTLTTIGAINTLPGGGGSTVLTPAEVSSILAAAGIAA